jgi:DNA-binding NarL/FixJ family response regulator
MVALLGNRPQLVIIDYSIRQPHAVELIKAVKHFLPGVKILFTSFLGTHAIEEEALLAGADMTLRKGEMVIETYCKKVEDLVS